MPHHEVPELHCSILVSMHEEGRTKKVKICKVAFQELCRRVLEICQLDDAEKTISREIDRMTALEEEKCEDNIAYVEKQIWDRAKLKRNVEETACPVVGMTHPIDVMARLNAETEERGVGIAKVLKRWDSLQRDIRSRAGMLERDIFNLLEPLSANELKKAGKVDLNEAWRRGFRESLLARNIDLVVLQRRASVTNIVVKSLGQRL